MYVPREFTERFDKVQKTYNIVAVVGARQAGKTTFLKEQMKRHRSSYVMLDDPDARSLFEEDIKKFEKQYVEGYDVTVLDEVQYCREAGPKLKYLADTGRRIWLTSSSEVILGKEILSYLVGRVSIMRMYPFSLTEFLDAKAQKAVTKPILERLVWEHMIYGGYPRVVLTEDPEMKKTILKDLHETMLLKDVSRTFGIENTRVLEELAKYLAVNAGAILSYGSVSRDIGISFPALKKYLDAMKKSYLIVCIPPFHTNKSKEIVKQPKLYFLDTGLRNAIADSFGAKPDGKLFENYVLSELVRMGMNVRYWRTKQKQEVDFVVDKDEKLVPVEVKLKASGVERSLRSFINTYRPETAMVVTYRGERGKTRIGNCKVIFTDVAGLKEFMMSKSPKL